MATKKKQLEINMHHLREVMQYWQAPWAILTKFCVIVAFLGPFC